MPDEQHDPIAAYFRAIEERLDFLQEYAVSAADSLARLQAGLELSSDGIAHILSLLTPPLPVGFKVSETALNQKGENMPPKKATIDFQILPNGTVKYTSSPVDPAGLVVALPAGTSVPAGFSSDPSTISVAPDPTDSTGLTFIGTGLKAGTGIVFTISATLPNGTVITGSAVPVDVEPAPDLPSGFTIAEQ